MPSKWPRINRNKANAKLANRPFANLFREDDEMTDQTRLIQYEDTPLFSGVPLTVTEPEPVDELAETRKALLEEQERNHQLIRDLRGWMDENADLRQRLTLAEAERDKWQRWYEGVLGAKKMWFGKAVERAKALSMARRWARAWKQAAKNEREARYILQVLLAEYEAHGRIAPIPVVGTLTGRNAHEEWQAIHAALGAVGERD